MIIDLEFKKLTKKQTKEIAVNLYIDNVLSTIDDVDEKRIKHINIMITRNKGE
jgi:hypothetical protein